MRTLPAKAGKEKTLKRCLAAVTAVFLVDRALKALIVARYAEGDGFPVLPGIFHITRVNNTGAAFGLMKGLTPILIAISLVCVIFLATSLWRASDHRNVSGVRAMAFSLVMAGALGNLVDRVFYGYVIDFLDFRVWPVFNLADISICVGAGLIVLGFFWEGKKA